MVRQPVLEKEKSEFKPAVLSLQIDLVSHPAHGEGVSEYIINPCDVISLFVL